MKSVQIPVQPTVQTNHPDHMVKVNETVSNSPLFTLASVFAEFLEAATLETASPSAQGKDSKKRIPSIDIDTPPKELIPYQYLKQPIEPVTHHQPIVDQLTQELEWSAS